jgi:chorismate dehydratase
LLLKPLRISIVQYLNTAPLVRGFTHGPWRGKYELAFTVPSLCAEALGSGAADMAIIPAIEYQRMDGLVILPNLAIASKRSVRSLLLVSKKPIQELKRVALDRSSRSTQALTRILCEKSWHIAPEFFEAEPDLPAMLAAADAALLIGDPALRLSLEAGATAGAAPDGGIAFGGEQVGLRDGRLFIYDMVEKWRAMTGLPAVLAVWAARPAVLTAEVLRDFKESLDYGLTQLNEISEEASLQMKLPAAKLRRYLTENIDYRLDEENLQGLRRYYQFASEMGLIPGLKEIELAGTGRARESLPELAVAKRP